MFRICTWVEDAACITPSTRSPPTKSCAAAEIIRRERASTDSWRFASIDLDEPAKADVLAWRQGDPMPRRSLRVLWDRRTTRPYEAVVDLDRRDAASCPGPHVPGVTPNFTAGRMARVRGGMKADPDVVAALAERGITDLDLVLIDVWTYGARGDARAVPGPPARLGRHLGARDPDRQPVRASGVRAEAHRRHEHHGAARDRRTDDVVGPPRGDGRVRARLVPGQALRADIKPLHDHPARRAVVRDRRHRGAVAELVDAAGLQLPRGPGALPGAVRRSRHRGTSPTGCPSPR